jgi:hypothetical protein
LIISSVPAVKLSKSPVASLAIQSWHPHRTTTVCASSATRSPKVRELADAGKTISGTAKTPHMHVKRVALIASENGLKFNS